MCAEFGTTILSRRCQNNNDLSVTASLRNGAAKCAIGPLGASANKQTAISKGQSNRKVE